MTGRPSTPRPLIPRHDCPWCQLPLRDGPGNTKSNLRRAIMADPDLAEGSVDSILAILDSFYRFDGRPGQSR